MDSHITSLKWGIVIDDWSDLDLVKSLQYLGFPFVKRSMIITKVSIFILDLCFWERNPHMFFFSVLEVDFLEWNYESILFFLIKK